MKLITYLAASAVMFTWMACGHGRPVDESETTVTTPGVIPANSTLQPTTTPVSINSQTAPSTVIPANTTAAVGMNPAHGQPGHRCDIAVGAPLNSPVAPQTAPTAVTTPVTTPINISTDKISQPVVTTAVGPGMNPAHGQPGHRCDIAVGAPLNSPPTQQPATNTATPVNISSDQLTKTAANTPVAPGMNPAHGQPGHRCEIAVGAPLNSKPTIVAGTPSTNTVSSSQSIPSIVPIKTVPDSTK